jgi:hypothetical protein
MTRTTTPDWRESAPRWIVAGLAVYLALDLMVIYLWHAAGQELSIQFASENPSTMPVTILGCVELYFCVLALRGFRSGAPLRPFWLMMTVAAAARALSGIAAQLLGTDWIVNPLTWGAARNTVAMERVRLYALAADGPLRLAVLAVALVIVLRAFRQTAFWSRLSSRDWAAAGVVCFYTLCRFVDIGIATYRGLQIAADPWISLAGLPILCVLFLQAARLRQAALKMGDGMVGKVFQTLAWGLLLTGCAEIALWVIPPFFPSVPLALSASVIRMLVAATFALAPAYQVAAQRQALNPAAARSATAEERPALLAQHQAGS